MKILKKLSSGLIVNETFGDLNLDAPLISNASITLGTNYVNISGGSIYLNVGNYDNLVFVIDNSFIPTSTDVGGIEIIRGYESRKLYEYAEEGSLEGNIPYAKVKKIGNIYSGYYSNDGETWSEKGSVAFTDADTMGVSVTSSQPYRLNAIRAYKSEYIKISQLLPGWVVKAYNDQQELLVDNTTTEDSIYIQLPSYPFTGTIKILDGLNYITDVDVSDMWGGDEYLCTVNVDILDSNNTLLEYSTQEDIGILSNDVLETWFTLRNNNEEQTTVTLSIAEYSPFGDWITLAPDVNGAPGTYATTATLTLESLEEQDFWIKVEKDLEDIRENFDYKSTSCLFYLCIE